MFVQIVLSLLEIWRRMIAAKLDIVTTAKDDRIWLLNGRMYLK